MFSAKGFIERRPYCICCTNRKLGTGKKKKSNIKTTQRINSWNLVGVKTYYIILPSIKNVKRKKSTKLKTLRRYENKENKTRLNISQLAYKLNDLAETQLESVGTP